MTTRIGYAIVFVAGLLTLGCGQKPKAVSPEVERIWSKHESVVDSALRTHKHNEEELLAAVSFFEKTTGIKSPRGLDETGLAVVPTDELNKDLERWRAWYVEHQHSLYVDATTGELRLRPSQVR